MAIALLVASPDEHFREVVRDNLLNLQNAKVVAEYPEVSSNLYIRVLQDLERHADAALLIDLASDAEAGLKALERVKQAAPDLYVIASNYSADGETVIGSLRAGASRFAMPSGAWSARPGALRIPSASSARCTPFWVRKAASARLPWPSIMPVCWPSANSAWCCWTWTGPRTTAACRSALRRNIRCRRLARTSPAWTRRCLRVW